VEEKAPMTFTKENLRQVVGRAVLIAVLFFAAYGISSSAHADNQDAMAVVKDTVGTVLGILKNPEYKNATEARRQKLRDAIEGHFDWSEMSSSALGYHWRSLSAADREQFSELFKRFLEASYIGKIESYSGQQINFVREVPNGPGYSTVNTTIVQPDGDAIKVNYALKQENGAWKVTDVTIDAISIVANYRNQFNRVINNQGVAALLSDLKRKQAQIESGN
jgi:phospholipid transport system substrate-binding protein